MTGMRGAALLLVLWLVALLTALVGAYALTARIEALQGRVGSRGAMAQEIARAGMEYALVRVADRNPETHWQPNGRAYAWRFDGHDVQVRIIDETGKGAYRMTSVLKKQGFRDVSSMEGGMKEWKSGGMPVEVSEEFKAKGKKRPR